MWSVVNSGRIRGERENDDRDEPKVVEAKTSLSTCKLPLTNHWHATAHKDHSNLYIRKL